MKTIVFLSALLFFCASVFSQKMTLTEINLVGGKNFSSFLFKDSDGAKDKTLNYNMLNSFGVNFGLQSGNHILRPEILFRQAGAKSDFEGTALSWKMNYLDVNIAYLYSVVNTSRFSISPGIGIGAGYMLNGDQYIGETRYQVSDTDALKRFDFGFQGLTNFKAHITDFFSISLEYRFGMGITQIENDVNAQKSRNIYHAALLGLGFTIGNKTAPRN